MGTVLLIILGLLLFQLLIVIHEYGHFLVAKRYGVEVKEFGLGLPPRLVGKTIGRGIFRSYYSLNWLPIGGFVRLKGEHDSADEAGTYGSCSLRIKAKIILAGVVVNFVFAVLLFSVLAATGIPRFLPAEPLTSEQQFTIASDTKIVDSKAIINLVEEDSPADKAGLVVGDQIVAIGGYSINSYDDLRNNTANFASQTTGVQVIRDKQQTLDITVSFRSIAEVEASHSTRQTCLSELPERFDCPPVKGYLGVSAADLVLQRSTWSAPITGVALSLQYTKVTFQGLWRAMTSVFAGDTQTASQSVAGPIGIFFLLKEGASYGVSFVLMIIAIISLTLAIMNALPIPALDGGRLALTVVFNKIIKRPLTKSLEERIVGTSMAVLLLLIILISIVDIKRFF